MSIYMLTIDVLLSPDSKLCLNMTVWPDIEEDAIYVIHHQYVDAEDKMYSFLANLVSEIVERPVGVVEMAGLPPSEVVAKLHPYTVRGAFGWWLHVTARTIHDEVEEEDVEVLF